MRPHGPQEIDLHVEILQVTLGIIFSRLFSSPRTKVPIQPLGIPFKNTRYSASTRKGKPCIWDNIFSFFLSFFSFFSVDRDIFTPSLQSRSEFLEIYCLAPPPPAWMCMWMDMVWTWIRSGRSSSSISFLPLRGWKLLFLCFFFLFGWAGEWCCMQELDL